MKQSRALRHSIGNAALWLCALGLAAPAQALDMEFFDGDLYVTMSHSLTYGINVSAEKPNSQTIYGGRLKPAPASGSRSGVCPYGATRCGNGGGNSGPNDDQSKQAFKTGGTTANQFKGTTDLRATWGEFTAFTRLLYFYDWEIMNQSRELNKSTHYESRGLTKSAYGAAKRVEFSKEAEEEIGQDVRTLDLYVSWETFIGDHPLTLRVGDQVINWGQSTFLPGIGLTNPVDLNRLFAPGFELRELFKPVGMFFASFGVTENIALEAYYQYDWEPVVLPPGGSFFAINDYTGAGPDSRGLGLVCLDGSPTDLSFEDDVALDGTEDSPGLGGLCVNSAPTQTPDNGDEFGIRLGITLPWLNYTQLDFYAIRYHNRLPHVGADIAGIVPNAGDLVCTAAGTPCPSVSADIRANPGQYPSAAVKYLPDMWAYGFSFSGNIPGGWTMQGEISYKKDFPMQVSLPELIGAAGWIDIFVPATAARVQCSLRQLDLTGICDTLDLGAVAVGPVNIFDPGDINLPQGIGCDPAKEDCDDYCQAAGGAGAGSYAGNCAYDLGAAVASDGAGQGYVKLDLMQTQVTFLKLFPQMFGGDTMIFLAEIIANKIVDMPSDIMFEKSDFSDFSNRKRSRADDFGWGYRILIRNEYTNLFGTSWGVAPTLVLFHDVNGTPPSNAGTFLEDRKQAILVLPFTYSSYQIAFKYGWFGGAPQSNVLQDRDSFSLTFTASM